jgi:pyruvate formate lyase activating enzyme
MNIDSITGNVLRIEKTSMHDGDGLRTVVFIKGCPLRCEWCSTPESQKSNPQIGYIRSKCNGCKTCVESCQQKALSYSPEKGVIRDMDLCRDCFECVVKCPQGAFVKYGKQMSVSEVIKEIEKDEIFFFHSNGGVTLSGGEVLMQPDFAAKILEECNQRGINTIIETSLHSSYDNIQKLSPWLNSMYVDIKHMNNEAHKYWTGIDNSLILENIRKVDESQYDIDICFRIPIIPGVNDSELNLKEVADFCRGIRKTKEIELLPYHRLGIDTYENLGIDYSLKDIKTPDLEYVNKCAKYLVDQDLKFDIKVGGVIFNKNRILSR